MNNLEYLNQISAAPAPSSVAKPSLFSSLNKKVLLIIVGALVALGAVLGALSYFSSRSSEIPELSSLNSLYLRLNALSETIEAYNDKVKSPALRSSGRSLAVILENDKSSLSSLLASDYGEKVSSLKPDASLEKESKDLLASLEKARLNGLLDRTYANELEYAVSVLLAVESSALDKTENESLKSVLESSTSSLENIESDLSDYLKSSN